MKFVGSYLLSRVTRSRVRVGRPYRGPHRRHVHVIDLIVVVVVMCKRVAAGLEFVDGTPSIGG